MYVAAPRVSGCECLFVGLDHIRESLIYVNLFPRDGKCGVAAGRGDGRQKGTAKAWVSGEHL